MSFHRLAVTCFEDPEIDPGNCESSDQRFRLRRMGCRQPSHALCEIDHRFIAEFPPRARDAECEWLTDHAGHLTRQGRIAFQAQSFPDPLIAGESPKPARRVARFDRLGDALRCQQSGEEILELVVHTVCHEVYRAARGALRRQLGSMATLSTWAADRA